MSEQELREKLKGLNSSIQQTQRSIDQKKESLKHRRKEKENEEVLRTQIEDTSQILKSLEEEDKLLDEQITKM